MCVRTYMCMYVLHADILYNTHRTLHGNTKMLLLKLWIKAMVTVLNLILVILLMVFWSLWYMLHLISYSNLNILNWLSRKVTFWSL